MDIGAPTMTTLIDDGLVESCLNKPVAVIDLDKLTVVDIDNIDATIEDPGYILEEDSDTSNRKEVNKPLDKNRSFALPVTFFDITSNINLLKKCRPISIKIVDCNIYPWYYRKKKHTVKSNSTIYKKDEDLDQCKLRYDSTNLIDVTLNVSDQVDSEPSISLPKINLSPEQRSFVLKIKEETDNQAYLNEAYINIIDDIHKETSPSKNHEDLTKVNLSSLDVNTSECSFNNRIEHHDLLTCKEIAQTIVWNVENSAVSNKTDNMYVQNQNTNTNETCVNNMSINLNDSVRNIPEQNKEERKKVSTSPILPYTIKRQKNTKSKEKMLPTPPKAKRIMERCIDSNKNCDKFMSSVNQIIPHYHSKLSVQANNNNYVNFTNVFANQMHFQEPISISSSLHCHQQSNKKDVLSGNIGSISAYDCQGRLVTGPYNVADLSYLDLCKELCNNRVFNSCEITKDERNIQNSNSLRFIRRPAKQLSNENCGISPQTSIPSDHFYDIDIPNSTCVQNNYVNYSSTRIPMQRQVGNVNNTTQCNPLLSQMLNTNNIREYYQSVHVHSDLDPRPVMTSSPYPSTGQNIRLPPKPPLPAPDYESYWPSSQYTQHENFQCSNAGTLLQEFQNIGNTNIFQDKVNSGLKNLVSIPNNARKDYNNMKFIPIDPPKATVSISPTVDSVKQNIYPQIDLQNINKASSEFCRNMEPKMLTNTNTKSKRQNIVKGPVKPKITKDVKKTKTHNLDAMINVLSNNKSDCLSSKAPMSYAQDKKMASKDDINNHKKQHGNPELNQQGTTFKINEVSNTYYTIVHPAKVKDIKTPEKVEFKINGYSPPILPIPSFKKSLEMLSGIQDSGKLPGNNYSEADANIVRLDISKDRRKKKDFTNITRKRKLFMDEKVYGNSKRISLQEYKLRRSENMNNI